MTNRADRISVIDIGSNSGRGVVYQHTGDGHLEIVADARVPLRLARDVAERGRLSESAIERTLQALGDFLAVSRGAGTDHIVTVATSAVRESENGQELVDRAAELGIDVRVIDGEREAWYSFLGSLHGLKGDDGLLIDVGGGSMEVSRARDREMAGSWTLPLGALRLSDRFLLTDPPDAEEMDDLRDHVLRTVEEAGIPRLRNGEFLAGTGGTVRNLASVDERLHRYFIPNLHGFVLTLDRVERVLALLASRRLDKRMAVPGLNADRADSIIGGALVVDALMHHTGATELVVSGQGLREGVALSELGLELRSPRAAREASVAALAARFATWDAKTAARRADAAGALVDGIVPKAAPEARELLHHAATALDLGKAIDYYERHAQAASVVLAANLDGFSHRQRAILGAILRQAGGESVGKSFRPLLTKEDRAWIPRAGVLLALADEMERRTPRDEALVIACEVRKSGVLVDAPALASWSPRAVGDRFRRAFNRPLVVGGELRA